MHKWTCHNFCYNKYEIYTWCLLLCLTSWAAALKTAACCGSSAYCSVKPRSVETFSARSHFYTNCRSSLVLSEFRVCAKWPLKDTNQLSEELTSSFFSFLVLIQHYWFALCHSIDNARRLKRSSALALSHWDWVTEYRNDEGIRKGRRRTLDSERREKIREGGKVNLKLPM